jgi:hypothetical protein
MMSEVLQSAAQFRSCEVGLHSHNASHDASHVTAKCKAGHLTCNYLFPDSMHKERPLFMTGFRTECLRKTSAEVDIPHNLYFVYFVLESSS